MDTQMINEMNNYFPARMDKLSNLFISVTSSIIIQIIDILRNYIIRNRNWILGDKSSE
jgi:hypothetical protein